MVAGLQDGQWKTGQQDQVTVFLLFGEKKKKKSTKQQQARVVSSWILTVSHQPHKIT